MSPRLMLIGTLLLAACGSSPKTQFYALMPLDDTPRAAAAGYFAAVLPVQVPEALDRKQLVIYGDGNQVEVLEQSHWAGSFKDEVKLAQVAALARRGIRNIDGAPPPEGRPTYRLMLTINRLTVYTQQASQWQASWSWRAADGSKNAICSAAGVGPAAGSGGAGAAEAYRAAVAALAARVAESLRRLAAGAPAPGCS